ncbi:MAG: hypothetical protein OXO48_13810 [Caldilineaceae bacterium]|nr:hypothetical protein [Caldilineaceae bacterium]
MLKNAKFDQVVFAIRAGSAVGFAVVGIVIWHYASPEDWHFLTDQQINLLSATIFSAALVDRVYRHINDQ